MSVLYSNAKRHTKIIAFLTLLGEQTVLNSGEALQLLPSANSVHSTGKKSVLVGCWLMISLRGEEEGTQDLFLGILFSIGYPGLLLNRCE